MRKRRRVRGITLPKPRKTKPGPDPICGQCFQDIDLAAVQRAIREGYGYVHECGRPLYVVKDDVKDDE